MSHNRGFHNLMQRRANYRSPAPPPRLHKPPPRVRVSAPALLRATYRHYKHRHGRPQDRKSLAEAMKAMQRISRSMDRQRMHWERAFGFDGVFGPPPGRVNISLQKQEQLRWRIQHGYSSTTMGATTWGYGYGHAGNW